MEIVRDFLLGSEQPVIRHYRAGEIRVRDAVYTGSIVVTPAGVVPEWPPQTAAELEPRHVEWLLELDPRPEMVLIGTGERQHFPPRATLASLWAAGVGVEIMDTAAACRTWNIVLAEGRRAAAALIVR